MKTPHTPESFASLLHGREYGSEILPEETAIAKANGLVVVYGYSDDNCELNGAINDEVGCYGGGKIHILPSGKVYQEHDRDEEEVLEKYGLLDQVQNGAAFFTAVWCDSEGPSWTYKAEFPHATFDIMEDGEVYGRGIVFRLADAFPQETVTAPPLLGHWRHSNGVLCCGSLRIATDNFDTSPSADFVAEIWTWICETLNKGGSKQ